MTDERANRVAEVCAAWGRGPAIAIGPLGRFGFSGSPVHVVTLADVVGRFVLKPFAPHVTRPRAEWVHGVMQRARAAGVTEVPDVLETVAGGSVVEDGDGRLWELVRFVDGRPDAAPTPDRAAAALDVLARLHWSLGPQQHAPVDRGPSPGVERRVQQARELLSRPWSAWLNADGVHHEAAGIAPQVRAACRAAEDMLSSPRGRRSLMALATARMAGVQRQAVVRDIWSDHVLFDVSAAARVAGLVDFHAAGIDTPLTDIARLLGSWEPPADGAKDPAAGVTQCWSGPLAAYERGRGEPLTPAELWLCDWLHASAVICGLDNWFRWTLEENRLFPDEKLACARIQRLLAALPPAIHWLADAGNQPV